MLYGSDRYSPAGAPLPIQGNRPGSSAAAAELHRMLQRAQPIPFKPSSSPDNRIVPRSPPSSNVFRKPNTPPKYELVRKVPSPTPLAAQPPPSVCSSLNKPSVLCNSQGAVVRSCLKAPAPQKSGKKGRLTFDKTLENVCVFVRGSMVTDIKGCERYGVKDTGDVNATTLSASLALLETWTITSKNTLPMPAFGSLPVVLDSVQLENGRVLVGNILVRNLDYNKTVLVHYTIDNWTTSHDVSASYHNTVSQNNGDFRGIDRFVFRIELNREFGSATTAGNVSFALRYDVGGCTHWDNNRGANYRVELRRPTTGEHRPAPVVPESRPLFPWHDPTSARAQSTHTIRPPSTAPIPIPAAPRVIPKKVDTSKQFIPISPPTGSPIATAAHVTLPLSAEGRRKMRAIALAKTSTLSTPSLKYSPPSTPVLPVPSGQATRRSPSPTSFSDAIEMPFSAGSLGAMSHMGRRPSFGGSSLYADGDSFIAGFGCSPPSHHTGYAACRA
ncbi:putative phosphatase regulatory subunit-domain-containing protein [Powellomyces hirtus]|nr:putative phosphatase regulatory subunit-domain-containing protein [Powellomyces hirtus]